MNNLVLSIVIPVHNGLNYTKNCIKSLINNLEQDLYSRPKVEIVVIDDGSTDGTSGWLKDEYPMVHVLRGSGDLWWSGGINKGVYFALNELKSDYILWWNNDILPAENYFHELFQIIEKSQPGVLIGSKIFVLDQDNLIWGMGGRFNPKNGDRFMYGEMQPDNNLFQKPFEVDWFPGMGTAIHKSVFETIGFLDEKNFPQYHGDSDYTFRARKAGFKLIAFNQLRIKNDNTNTGIKHQGSLKYLYQSLTGIKSNYNIKKDFLFFKKHATSPIAYKQLFHKYFRYIGGFLKWSILGVIGIHRKVN